MQDMGNPVLEERNDVLVLDTKYIMELVSGTVIKAKTIDQDQYSKCLDELLSKCVMHVTNPLNNSIRVDSVWDLHQRNRLKGTTRQKTSKGVRRPVVLSVLILNNWKDFPYVWMRTRQNCLASCDTRWPFYKERTNSVWNWLPQCALLFDTNWQLLSRRVTWNCWCVKLILTSMWWQ